MAEKSVRVLRENSMMIVGYWICWICKQDVRVWNSSGTSNSDWSRIPSVNKGMNVRCISLLIFCLFDRSKIAGYVVSKLDSLGQVFVTFSQMQGLTSEDCGWVGEMADPARSAGRKKSIGADCDLAPTRRIDLRGLLVAGETADPASSAGRQGSHLTFPKLSWSLPRPTLESPVESTLLRKACLEGNLAYAPGRMLE